jgi:DNA-binding LacI/PurR family transcriptional regulator
MKPRPASTAITVAVPHLVKPATLKQVRDAADQLGYVSDGAARALVMGRSQTVGSAADDQQSHLLRFRSRLTETAVGRALPTADRLTSTTAPSKSVRTPALTTIHVPTDVIGKLAAERRLAVLQSGQALQSAEVKTRLVKCGSSGPAPVS